MKLSWQGFLSREHRWLLQILACHASPVSALALIHMEQSTLFLQALEVKKMSTSKTKFGLSFEHVFKPEMAGVNDGEN